MARRLQTRKKGKQGSPDLTGNPDFRARPNFPLPPVEELDGRRRALLTPGRFAVRRLDPAARKRRERVRTLAVMAGLRGTLVWRPLPALREALRVGAREGLGEWAPVPVSRPARASRLGALPAPRFAQVYEEALARGRQPTEPRVQTVSRSARLTARWAAAGSTREARRDKLQELREPKTPLGGKLLAVVELGTRRPQPSASAGNLLGNRITLNPAKACVGA
jgi:hypothetical protein